MSKSNVPPLKRKIMTLSELQMETVNLLRRVRFQFDRQAHEDGMSDNEFIEAFIDPLETRIYEDRQMAKMLRKRRKEVE